MFGVKTLDEVIIATYSVVTKDIPSYTVYGGYSAKFIKDRFDEELRIILLQFCWCHYDELLK